MTNRTFIPRKPRLRAYAEIPVAFLSWCLHAVVKRGVRIALAIRGKSRPPQWNVLSEELIEDSLTFTFLAIEQLWNTHASMAYVGFVAERDIELEFDTTALAESSTSWSAILVSMPSRAAAYRGRGDSTTRTLAKVQVKPGRYLLVVRCYEPPGPDLRVPAITMDGEVKIPERVTPSNWNRILCAGLKDRSRPLFRALNFHVFTMVSLGKYIGEPRVYRRLLPFGNPQTHFVYGELRRGEVLHVQVDKALLTTNNAYLTIYGRDNLPRLASVKLAAGEYAAPPQDRDTIFVIRIHSLDGQLPNAASIDGLIQTRTS